MDRFWGGNGVEIRWKWASCLVGSFYDKIQNMSGSIRIKRVCFKNPEEALKYCLNALEIANSLPQTDPVLLTLDRMLREGRIEIIEVNRKKVYRPIRGERE